MKLSVATLRRFARLLLAALLLQAIAPALATSFKNDQHWVEVCSTSGPKWVSVDDAASASDADGHSSGKHCLFCLASPALIEFDAPAFAGTREPVAFSAPAAFPPVSILQIGRTIRSRAPPL